MKKRIIALAISVCMAFTLFPTTTLATEMDSGDEAIGASSACPHHTQHSETCGYAAATPGTPCGHLQEAGTYSCAPGGEVPADEGEPATPGEVTEGYACPHDDECGYIEEASGQPRTFEQKDCEICNSKDSGQQGELPPPAPFAASIGMQTLAGTTLEINKTTIGFAGQEWYVIGTKDSAGTANGVSYADMVNNSATLLVKDPGTGTSDTPYGRTKFNESSTSNNYKDSTLQGKMIEIYNGLDQKEKDLIHAREVDQAGIDQPNNQYLWPLSIKEANTIYDNTVRSYWSIWWLRSPGNISFNAACVSGIGVILTGSDVNLSEFGVRPAFNLNLTSVLFTSAAAGGKSTAAVGGGFIGASAPGDNLKLTVLDDYNASTNPTGQAVTIDKTLQTGMDVNIDYSGATTGTNQLVSCVVKDETGAVKYYGKLADTSSVAAGTATITLPSDYDFDNWTLEVFSEQANGDKYTDYASTPVAVTVATPNSHTVTFDKNGGDTDASPTSKTVTQPATTVDALPAPPTKADHSFAGWYTSGDGGVTLDTGFIVGTLVTGDITVYAKWTQNPPNTYILTVNLNGGNGTDVSASYAKNTVISINAGTQSNYTFKNWATSNGGTFANESAASTTFTMPGNATTITAYWTYTGGGTSSSDSSGDDRTTFEKAVDKSVDNIKTAKPGDTIPLDMSGNPTLPGKVLDALAGKDVTLELSMGGGAVWVIHGTDLPTGGRYGSLNFGINTKGSTLPVTVINNVTGEVKTMQLALKHNGAFGFRLTLLLETGKENAGLWANLYYYNPDTQALEYRVSSRIAADGRAALPFDHASDYAVVIDERNLGATVFTDTEGHWAKADIDFVAARGILTGTAADRFSPDTGMTRGMFVTALYRLAGCSQADGEGAAFTDIPDGAYYADAVRWAFGAGVTSGTTATTFSPDRTITRQELAALMANYARAMGYTLPETREAVTFADGASIASWAKDAVQSMQTAGVMNGKDGGRFDPTATATRAEVAAVLHRFLELVIDPATAQGLETGT